MAAYDERESIDDLVGRLDRSVKVGEGARRLLLFVVEGEDGTVDRLRERAREIPDLRILYQARPRGLGEAFRAGFAAVPDGFDVVVTLDADLNHAPEEIPDLVAEISSGRADIVVGSRDLAASRVEGIPAWKRWLSHLVNRTLGWQTRFRVSDKTSGFRAYRRDVLRRLQIRAPGFSFLADLLLQAHREGRRIVEVPIHFRYRQRGRSKLPFLRTALEYLGLLARQVPAAERSLLLWTVVGLGLRLVLTYPVHRFYAESDASLTALTALRILDGEPQAFFNHFRIGALGCWWTALLFSLFGRGRAVFAAAPLSLSVATMLILFSTARRLLGRERARWALPLIAVPLPAFTFWTYMPVAYAEILFTCALILWSASALLVRGVRAPQLGLFGFACGLGLWTSALSLCCSIPAALVLVREHHRSLRARPVAVVGAAGGAFLLGAAPWWISHASRRFATLQEVGHLQPVGLREALDNLRFVLLDRLPELVAWVKPLRDFHPSELAWGAARAALLSAVLAWGILVVARRSTGRPGGSPAEPWRRRTVGLLLAVLGVTLLANTLASAGSLRKETVRYVLPVALVLPWLPALAAAALSGSRARRLLRASVLLFVAASAANAFWPGHPSRERWRRELAADRRIVDRFEALGVGAVAGPYSHVYALNYVSDRSLPAIPVEALWDEKRATGRLPSGPVRWAILGIGRHARTAIVECGPSALPGGELVELGERRWSWIGPPPPGDRSAREVLSHIRRSCSRLAARDYRGPIDG